MRHIITFLVFLVFLAFSYSMYAQKVLQMQQYGHDWYVSLQKKSGDDASEISDYYNVPEYLFTELNAQIPSPNFWQIPLDVYNRTYYPSNKITSPLYWINDKERSAIDLSIKLRMSSNQLMSINQQKDYFQKGDTIWAGWLLHRQSLEKPTLKTDNTETHHESISSFHRQYLKETFDGSITNKEKGAVAFFNLKYRKKGFFYAFHNSAAKGSIIKVTNPSNQRTIFAKVLGPVPGNAIYHNCIMGLSDNAMTPLGISNERKLWCELEYAGY